VASRWRPLASAATAAQSLLWLRAVAQPYLRSARFVKRSST